MAFWLGIKRYEECGDISLRYNVEVVNRAARYAESLQI